jgi:hypothetical protein
MQNSSIKDIITLAIALFVIVFLSTLSVLGFNSVVGFSTDLSNDDVLTSISVVSFLFGLALKYYNDKITN